MCISKGVKNYEVLKNISQNKCAHFDVSQKRYIVVVIRYKIFKSLETTSYCARYVLKRRGFNGFEEPLCNSHHVVTFLTKKLYLKIKYYVRLSTREMLMDTAIAGSTE
jgi:hypothetical protein